MTESGKHELRMMDGSGDRLLLAFDPAIEGETAAAAEQFLALQRQGYGAVARGVEHEGPGIALVEDFDPSVETTVMYAPVMGG